VESEDYAVRGDQQGEPGQAEDPGEDDVGEPVVAEEDPAENHCRCPGDGQHDGEGDGEVAAEAARNEVGDDAGNDGAVQRVTGGKGNACSYGGTAALSGGRGRPTIALPTVVKVSEPATAMIIKIIGVRERHRHTINSVAAPAIKVMYRARRGG
jgi:hypothetical protein